MSCPVRMPEAPVGGAVGHGVKAGDRSRACQDVSADLARSARFRFRGAWLDIPNTLRYGSTKLRAVRTQLRQLGYGLAFQHLINRAGA